MQAKYLTSTNSACTTFSLAQNSCKLRTPCSDCDYATIPLHLCCAALLLRFYYASSAFLLCFFYTSAALPLNFHYTYTALPLFLFEVYINDICNEKTFASKDFGWHCTIDGWQEQCWMGLELFSFFLLGSSSIIQGNLSMQKKFHLRPTSSQYERIDHITLWLFVGWMAGLNSS